MVVYYEKTLGLLRKIKAVEHDVMTPTIPANLDFKGQIEYYNSIGLEFISLPYELGGRIFEYSVCINESGEFIGLQPKEMILND